MEQKTDTHLYDRYAQVIDAELGHLQEMIESVDSEAEKRFFGFLGQGCEIKEDFRDVLAKQYENEIEARSATLLVPLVREIAASISYPMDHQRSELAYVTRCWKEIRQTMKASISFTHP